MTPHELPLKWVFVPCHSLVDLRTQSRLIVAMRASDFQKLYGKRKVEDKWVVQKFSFHVRAACVNQQFSSVVKIGRPPTLFTLAERSSS